MEQDSVPDPSDMPTVEASASDTARDYVEEHPRAGQVLGRYRLLRPLGRGGFAEVWEAQRLEDGLLVALKTLKARATASREALARFEREGRLAASLSHPRAVYVLAAETLDGVPAIAMELAPHGTLQDLLDKEGPLPFRRAVDLVLDLIEGLAAAGRLGILHRDIKPSNCFLDREGRAKIGDFGISKSLELEGDLTATGAFLGTPIYASPEQLRGREIDLRSDLYSVGATLYTLLAGRPPFRAGGAVELVAQILTEPPPPIEVQGQQVPAGLKAVVSRLLAKDPARRFPTYEALRSALLPFSSSGLVVADLPRRATAYVLDLILVAAVLGMAGLIQDPWGRTAAVDVFDLSVFAYFVLGEWRWRGTPGKRLLRLRVTNTTGERLSFGQAVLRNAVYFGLPLVVTLIAMLLGASYVWASLISAMTLVPIFGPMRRRNGFAGLHDLAAGARVMRPRPAIVARSEVALAERTSSTAARAVLGQRGSYRLVSIAWEQGNGSLFIARDETLDRPVWIFERPLSGDTKPQEADDGRPGRLHWLEGGVGGALRWDAFEAPTGHGYLALVRDRDALPWNEFHGLLVQLLVALEAAHERGDLPERLSLRQVWIDCFGKLRLAPFECPDTAEPAEAKPPLAGDWVTFLRLFVSVGLAGVEHAHAAEAPPRSPLPERARLLVERIWVRSFDRDALRLLVEEARNVGGTSTTVTYRRLAQLLTVSWLPLVITVSLLLGDVWKGEFTFDRLAEQSTAFMIPFAFLAPAAVVLAWAFRGGPVLRFYGIAVQTARGSRASRARCLARALVVWAPALAVLLLVGAGLTIEDPSPHRSADVSRPSGSQDDQLPAARRSSANIAYRTGFALGKMDRAVDTVPAGRVVGLLASSLFVCGTIIAIAHPARSLQDRIAGTRLVPR